VAMAPARAHAHRMVHAQQARQAQGCGAIASVAHTSEWMDDVDAHHGSVCRAQGSCALG
jgi:hypothetical protein